MRNERKKIPNTVSLPKYMLPDNNMMKAASKLKGDLKRMFPNSRPSKPEDVKKQFSKALIKQGKLRNYLKDGKTEVQPSLDKNRIINDILKNAHFDKDEKVEFEEVKNSTQKDRTKYKYFSKLMSKVDKIEFLKPKLTPFQKFRSISKGIYSLFKLYYSIKKLNNKLKSLKFDDLKNAYMVNEEIVKNWLIKNTENVLRTIVNDAEDIDYDFTTIIAFFGHKKIQEK